LGASPQTPIRLRRAILRLRHTCNYTSKHENELAVLISSVSV
jgi:hypothetical protein